MTPETLIERYPHIYHMTAADSWEAIKAHGILSTSAILDLLGINGGKRAQIERSIRPQSVTLTDPHHGTFVIRDQKPMSEVALERCLDGLTVSGWLRELNRRVFFWLTEGRLEKLRTARAHRDRPHLVLTFDTRTIVEKFGSSITLSPINTGSTLYDAPIRGNKTFYSIEDYPFEERRRSRGTANAIAELALMRSLPNVMAPLVEAKIVHPDGRLADP